MEGLASTREAVLGSMAFLIFWVLALFPSFPLLPVGRTAGALAGATLMVLFQVEPPESAYSSVDLSILGLLFGTMVVSQFLERADMFRYLTSLLSWKRRGAKDLLCRICFLIAIASAFFTNDTCCVVFTRFILTLCREENLPPEPFLIALASSANIGSSATPIGNPQNLVIAVQSGIPFGQFLLGIAPAMVVGLLVNTSLILAFYWKQLSKIDHLEIPTKKLDMEEESNLSALIVCGRSDLKNLAKSVNEALPQPANNQLLGPLIRLELPTQQADCHAETKDIASCSYFSKVNIDEVDAAEEEHTDSSLLLLEDNLLKLDREIHNRSSAISVLRYHSSPKKSLCTVEYPPYKTVERDRHLQKRKRTAWKVCVYLVALGMVVALLFGCSLTWCALTAAVALMALDFEDAGPVLDKVSYPLLVFFSGMFITVDGFNRTGIPTQLWNAVERHARINNASGLAVLVFVVLTLSNVASNVPTVLLLGPRIAQSTALLHNASINKAWLILAWTSTIAGNLTLIGSAANLIVCEQARKVQHLGYNLTFWHHLWFGFPATLIVVTVGLPLIQG